MRGRSRARRSPAAVARACSALGHRSLLAYPSTRDVIAKMNKIKFRQSYRPVAPIVAEEVHSAAPHRTAARLPAALGRHDSGAQHSVLPFAPRLNRCGHAASRGAHRTC